MITIVDGDDTYIYHPDENTAFKVTLEQAGQQAGQTETPSDFIEDVDTKPDKYRIVDSVVYDGAKCKIVEVTSADGQEQTRMWVREDYGIGPRRELEPEGEKVVLEFKNLKLGPQPPGTFELPAGVEVMDMSEMLKQIPRQGSYRAAINRVETGQNAFKFSAPFARRSLKAACSLVDNLMNGHPYF